MGRQPRIPAGLKWRPFTLQEALAAGITRRALTGKSWRRIGHALYCWTRLREDAWQLLQAWHRKLPNAVFNGRTAAWLHGLDLDPIDPVEVAVPLSSGIRSRPGISVRRSDVATRNVVIVRGLPVTKVDLMLSDLSRGLPPVEALVALDAATRAGLGRAANPLDRLAEPAESPMETRLRWLLLQAGLPRPQVQASVYDSEGRFVGRADLYYPAARLVIEYDGLNHRDRLVEDNRRQNLLISAGFHVLRFTAPDIRDRSGAVARHVREALTRLSVPA